MWPFQRKAETPASQGPQPAPAPVMRRDWAGLPPAQRLIGEHPLTAPNDRFSDDLATHHDPSVSSDTMGHHVGAEAPAGIVLALAQPVTRSDGPAMVQRPRLQRRADPAATDSGEWEVDEAASDGAGPAASPAERQAAPVLFELPVTAAEPSVQRLTRAPEGDPVPFSGKRRAPAPESVVSRSDDTPMPVADAPAAPAPRLTLGQARRLGLGPPISRVPDRAVQHAPMDATAMPLVPSRGPQSPTPSDAAPAPAAEPPTPATRVEPVTQPAPSMAVQRTNETSRQNDPAAAPTATPAGEDVGRLDLPLAPRTLPQAVDGPSIATETEPEDASSPQQPGSLPLVQRASAAGAPAAPAEPSPAAIPRIEAAAAPAPGTSTIASQQPLVRDASRIGSAPPATTAPESASLVAPLVGARRLRPTVALQRASERASEPAPADIEEPISRALDTSLAGVRIDRSDAGAAAADSIGARAFTEGDDVVLPAAQGPIGSGPARSLLAHELTHVAQQRRYGAALPGEASPQGRRLELQAQRVERAWGVESSSPALPPSPDTSSHGAPLPLAPVIPATVQRAMAAVTAQAEAAEARAVTPVVTAQRQPDDATPPAPMAGGEAAAGGTASAGATNAEPSEQSMDELAGRLYDRIRGRLKTELLVDRERAGFLTDLR
jgi:uncharacterized protein DUF4157